MLCGRLLLERAKSPYISSGPMLSDSDVRIRCQKCGFEHRKAIAWLRENNEMVCTGCSGIITLEGAVGGFRIFEIDRARRGLAHALQRLDSRPSTSPTAEGSQLSKWPTQPDLRDNPLRDYDWGPLTTADNEPAPDGGSGWSIRHP